jgi:hypothetical protein
MAVNIVGKNPLKGTTGVGGTTNINVNGKPLKSSISGGKGWSNVAAVYSALLSGERVYANIDNPTLKKIVEAGANHPFIAAGLGTGAYYGVKAAIPAILNIVPKVGGFIKPAAVAAPVAAASSTLNKYLVGGAIGAGAGYLLFGKGGASTAPQTQNPQQDQKQNPSLNPNQAPTQNTPQNPQQGGTATITGQGNTLSFDQSQNTTSYNYQISTQESIQNTYAGAGQSLGQEQTASSAGTNWATIALIGVAALLLLKE